MDLFIKMAAGSHVLKKAQKSERIITSKNFFHGKKSSALYYKNRLNRSKIVYPTIVPISTPNIQELDTKIRAS